jgi:drug/metabolite transporter (DMT)-like permease
MPSRALRYRWLLLAAAILFSTGGAAIKAAALTPWQVASFRSAVAAAALAAGLPAARRGWTLAIWPVSLAYAATLVLFVLATRQTTAAAAIFLQATAPLYVVPLAPLLLGERITRADMVQMLAIGLGLAMFFVEPARAAATAPNPAMGNLLGAGSGLTWALTVIGLRWMERRQGQPGGALAAVVGGNLAAFAIALPRALPVEHFTAADALVILYLGVFQIGLAYWCLATAIRHVHAFEATALLLVEPALNPVWAWLVQGEWPGAWACAGGAVILLATAAKTWRQSRGERAAP